MYFNTRCKICKELNTHIAYEEAGKPCGTVDKFLPVQLTALPAHLSVQ